MFSILFIIVPGLNHQLSWGSDVPPTLHNVFELLKSISFQWDAIGRELGVTHNDREIIRTDITMDTQRKLEEVIYKWIQSECTPVTWDNLVQALDRLHHQDVIKEIGILHSIMCMY